MERQQSDFRGAVSGPSDKKNHCSCKKMHLTRHEQCGKNARCVFFVCPGLRLRERQTQCRLLDFHKESHILSDSNFVQTCPPA